MEHYFLILQVKAILFFQGFMRLLKRIPILRYFIPDSVYRLPMKHDTSFKVIVGLGFIMQRLYNLLSSVAYLFTLYMIADYIVKFIPFLQDQQLVMSACFIYFSAMVGTLYKSTLMGNLDSAQLSFTMVKIYRIPPSQYLKCLMLYNRLSAILVFYLTLLIGHSIIILDIFMPMTYNQILIFIVNIIGLRTIGIYCVLRYKKWKKSEHKSFNRVIDIVFTVLLILVIPAGMLGLVAWYNLNFITVFCNIYLCWGIVFLSIYTFVLLKRHNWDNTILDSMASNMSKPLDVNKLQVAQLAKNIDSTIDLKKVNQLTGYVYVHELLYRKLRTKFITPIIRRVLIILGVGLVVSILVLINPFGGSLVRELKEVEYKLYGVIPIFIYYISTGRAFSELFYMNLDNYLVHYNFFKTPKTIMECMLYRFKKSFLLNACVGATFILVLTLVFYLAGMLNLHSFLYISLLTGISTIFFSVFYQCIYYLIPYKYYTLITGIMSYKAFQMSYKGFDPDLLIYIGVGLLLGSIILFYLTYVYGPKRFSSRLQI